MGILFDNVPLIHHDYRRFALFVNIARYLHVLLGKPLSGIDHE